MVPYRAMLDVPHELVERVSWLLYEHRRDTALVLPRDTLPHPRPDVARAHGHRPACLTRQILALTDRAYQGAGATFRTPYCHHREHYQKFNRDHARLRAPGERAFAQLKSWRLLR